jgi:hypothetical protein
MEQRYSGVVRVLDDEEVLVKTGMRPWQGAPLL